MDSSHRGPVGSSGHPDFGHKHLRDDPGKAARNKEAGGRNHEAKAATWRRFDVVTGDEFVLVARFTGAGAGADHAAPAWHADAALKEETAKRSERKGGDASCDRWLPPVPDRRRT